MINAKRLLFASIHSYLDPSIGAAMASRELLELLTARVWDCRVLCCGVLDYQRETPLDLALATMELPAATVAAGLSRGGSAEVIDLEVGSVRVTLMPTSSSRAEKSPNPREGAIFLDLADQVFGRFQPQVLLTYGGHPVSLELMRRARARGIAVVFHLHNFGYNDRRGFEDVSAIIFPSKYSRRLHQRRLGLDGVVIPDPIRLDQVIAELPGEPGGADAVALARVVGPCGDRGDGQWDPRARERPGRVARDAGGGGLRFHAPRALHAGRRGRAGSARGRALGRHDRAAVGRRGV